MKTSIIFLLSLCMFFFTNAQETIYHPEANAKKDISELLEKAQKEDKNVIVQVGGNWCSWCLLFNKFIHETPEVAKVIEDNYEYYHLNYSKENKNQDILDSYGNPEKNGFPVLVVLNPKGEVLHTQETGSLEEGKWYNTDRVMNFLNDWTPEGVQNSNLK